MLHHVIIARFYSEKAIHIGLICLGCSSNFRIDVVSLQKMVLLALMKQNKLLNKALKAFFG